MNLYWHHVVGMGYHNPKFSSRWCTVQCICRQSKHRKAIHGDDTVFRVTEVKWITLDSIILFLFSFSRATRGWAAVSPTSPCPPQWSPSPHPVCLTKIWSTLASALPTTMVPEQYYYLYCIDVMSAAPADPMRTQYGYQRQWNVAVFRYLFHTSFNA